MSKLLDVLKATIVGGLAFLLPVGVVVVVLGKLFAISRSASAALHDALFPQTESAWPALVLAILFLLLIALLAGLFARTSAGEAVFMRVEGLIDARLPVYRILKQTLGDMSGGFGALSGRKIDVVIFRERGCERLALVMDRIDDGRLVLFLPSAPAALTGVVVLARLEDVAPTELTPAHTLAVMRGLGAGLGAALCPRETAGADESRVA